jgi:multidrug resistance efflux pump
MPKAGPESLLTDDEKDHRIRMKLESLAAERERIRRTIKDFERRMQLQSAGARSHYEQKRDEAKADLKRVETELRKLEEERATELYGG